MPNRVEISQNARLLIFLGLAVILMGMGLVLSPSLSALWEGYQIFLTHPGTLDFDGLKQAGHFGTAFFNAGLLLVAALGIYYVTGSDIQGVHIAAAMMIVGFSFYGKNIINICFPIIGVFLRTWRRGYALSSVSAMACFSTAMAPVFSVLAFGTEPLRPGSPLAILVGILAAILAGIIFAGMLSYLPTLHHSYELFNAGFAAGLSCVVINCILVAFGLGHEKYPYTPADYVSGSNVQLGLLLLVLFAYLMAVGLFFGGGKQYKKMLLHRSKGGNYVEEFGFAACLINMGEIGLLCWVYVFVVGGQFCGPVYACIWTAVGFAMNGVSVRMFLPMMSGVYITAFMTGGVAALFAGEAFFAAAVAKAASRGMLLCAIFSCGLAPIAGRRGAAAGMFAAAAHCCLVGNIGVLHGWMSLYNNGLSLSLVAVFLYPAYVRIGEKYHNKIVEEETKNGTEPTAKKA
jgi:Predicted membrane-associated HD superfamily hydrolase